MSIFIPGAKAGGGGGGGSLSEEVLITPVEQPSHGFDSSDIGSPVYFDGSIWILAIADAPETVHAAVIRSIIDADNFVIQQGGRLEGISATIIDGGGPLTPGNFYRLSADNAGLVTDELVTSGMINAPVYLALDTADALILPYRADLNNIVSGVLDASRITIDCSNFANIVGIDAQTAFDSIDDQLGAGGGDLGTIQDWGDTEIPLGTIGGGQSNIDLDGGHVISATLTGNHTINFTSTAGHANTTWEALIDVGCAKSHKRAKSHKCAGVNTLSFEFDSTPITEPDGYDISGGGMYWFRFRKLGSLVVFSERKV